MTSRARAAGHGAKATLLPGRILIPEHISMLSARPPATHSAVLGKGAGSTREHPWVLQRFLTACVSYFESLAVPFSNSYTLYLQPLSISIQLSRLAWDFLGLSLPQAMGAPTLGASGGVAPGNLRG